MKEKKHKGSDEYIVYRVMLAFVMSAVFLVLMARLRDVIDRPTTYSQGKLACLIVAAVAAACAIVGVVSYLISVKRSTYRRGQVFNGMFFAYFSAVVSLSALLLFYDHTLGMKAVYLFIPGSAILFLIYSVYPKLLFVTSLTHFYAAAALYMLSRFTSADLRVFALTSALAVCVAAIVLFFVTKPNKGRLRIAGTDFILFGTGVNTRYLVALYSATGALLLASYLLASAVAFYCMIAVIAFIVVSIVHSTVKMM